MVGVSSSDGVGCQCSGCGYKLVMSCDTLSSVQETRSSGGCRTKGSEVVGVACTEVIGAEAATGVGGGMMTAQGLGGGGRKHHASRWIAVKVRGLPFSTREDGLCRLFADYDVH